MKPQKNGKTAEKNQFKNIYIYKVLHYNGWKKRRSRERERETWIR